jgi:hypothetical protein
MASYVTQLCNPTAKEGLFQYVVKCAGLSRGICTNAQLGLLGRLLLVLQLMYGKHHNAVPATG